MEVIKKLNEEPGIERMKRIERRIEVNELAKSLNINLRTKSKKTILCIVEYISDGKKIKVY